ncbi:hypothetical protein TFLX_03697 [Thermoflexales bacterium]|nr:hypothetical protein TFLX_03697 [Thermoflexales bacterium]
MTPNPWRTPIRLLFSVMACGLNYRQVAGFVKAMDVALESSPIGLEDTAHPVNQTH